MLPAAPPSAFSTHAAGAAGVGPTASLTAFTKVRRGRLRLSIWQLTSLSPGMVKALPTTATGAPSALRVHAAVAAKSAAEFDANASDRVTDAPAMASAEAVVPIPPAVELPSMGDMTAPTAPPSVSVTFSPPLAPAHALFRVTRRTTVLRGQLARSAREAGVNREATPVDTLIS